MNKTNTFTIEDELYHKANNIRHIYNKKCIKEVRDHCHKTCRYRSPACKTFTLK